MDFTITCDFTNISGNIKIRNSAVYKNTQHIEEFIEKVRSNYSIYDIYKITYIEHGWIESDTTLRDSFLRKYASLLPEKITFGLKNEYGYDNSGLSLGGGTVLQQTRTVLKGVPVFKFVAPFEDRMKHYFYDDGIPLFKLIFPDENEMKIYYDIINNRDK